MKVAIAFSGLPRCSFASSIMCWRRIQTLYNADVFVHTWAKTSNERKYAFDQIKSQFNPLVMRCDTPLDFYDFPNYNRKVFDDVNPKNVISAYTSFNRCMKLINDYCSKKATKYDIVIKARFDILVENFRLELLDGIAVPDDPLLERFAYCDFYGQTITGINDTSAYGSMDRMTFYSNIVHHVNDFYFNDEVPFTSELMVRVYFMKNNIPVYHKWTRPEIARK